MKSKIIKKVIFCLSIVYLITTNSCLTDEEFKERTPEQEQEEITDFLSKLEQEGYTINTTDLGIYYIILEEGNGPFPQKGDSCFLEYTGYFYDGTKFDSSHNYSDNGIWKFVFSEIKLIKGFEDGIKLMNKGARLELIIPSKLAYGAYGYKQIDSYTTLIYVAKMHDLKLTVR